MSAQLRGSSRKRRCSSQVDQNTNKRPKSSNRTLRGLTCPGCKEYFPHFTTKTQIIEQHMMRDEQCKSHIVVCPNTLCCQKFLSQFALDQHLRSKSNRQCLIADNERNVANTFPQSNVEFAQSNLVDTSIALHMSSDNKFSHEIVTHDNQSILFGLTDSQVTKAPNVVRKKSSCATILPLDSETSTSTNNIPTVTPKTRRIVRRSYFQNLDDSEDDSDYDSDTSAEDDFSGTDDITRDNTLLGFVSVCENNDSRVSNMLDSHDNGTSTSSSNVADGLQPNDDMVSVPSNLFISIYDTEQQEKDNIPEDIDFKNGIDLLHLLMSKRISLNRYTDFMKWKYDSSYKFPSFQDLIKSSTCRIYGPTLAEMMAPQVSMV